MKKRSLRSKLSAVLLAMLCCSPLLAQEPESESGDTLKVGDKAPDFEADTFDDKTVKLSDRFGDEGHPVVLLFSRANW